MYQISNESNTKVFINNCNRSTVNNKFLNHYLSNINSNSNQITTNSSLRRSISANLDQISTINMQTSSDNVYSCATLNEPSSILDVNLHINNQNLSNISNQESFATNPSAISICHLNINSLSLKVSEWFDIINKYNCDLFFLNETKLNEFVPPSSINHPCYTILRRDRDSRGGGVLVYIKKNIQIIKSKIIDKIEAIFFQIKLNNQLVHFIACYRPPDYDKNLFFGELDKLLFLINPELPIFIIGDFNVNILSNNYTELTDCLT
jgi:hypothetical protein